MNTEHIHNRLSPQAFAALMDTAKMRAKQLRREAIRDFWLAVARKLGCWLDGNRAADSSCHGHQKVAADAHTQVIHAVQKLRQVGVQAGGQDFVDAAVTQV